jgi:RecA/RadA recombinase
MATISKPFDPSKFTKSITKSIKGISTGFNDPDTWISTGNFALNKRISGNFAYGVPLGKITMFAGESGSGKSFICSGGIVKHAQEQGIFCVLIDSENALDEAWLKAVGVNTSPDKLMRISASLIDDVAKIISDFVEAYKTDYLDVPKEDRPKVLFVIDSLGMLLTPVEVAQFEAGDMKGDMGRKAKQLKALVTNITNMIGNLNIGIVMTNHTYASQNMFDSTPTISGGSGIIFASSIVVMMAKLKLKKDEDGNKTTDVQGIRSMCQVAKTRYAKPFEKIELEIPYSTGLDPYSGLFDYFVSKSVLPRTGNKYIYVDHSGTEHKYFEKEYRRNENGILDLIMNEWTDKFEENEQILDEELANNGVQP